MVDFSNMAVRNILSHKRRSAEELTPQERIQEQMISHEIRLKKSQSVSLKERQKKIEEGEERKVERTPHSPWCDCPECLMDPRRGWRVDDLEAADNTMSTKRKKPRPT